MGCPIRVGTTAQHRGPALFQVLRPIKGIVYPEDYLKAAGELLFVLLATAWGITYLTNPGVIRDNPIRTVMGYNNFCVGFDTPPATYVGLLMALPIIYLGIRYAWTDMERSVLTRDTLSDTKYYFSIVANIMYMVSICGFGLVFVVTPDVSVTVHFLAFIQLILVRFLVVWSNVVESPAASMKTLGFLWVYGIISVGLSAFGIVNLIHFADPTSTGPLIPHQLSMAFDYAWFACLALTTVLVPRGDALLVSTKVVPVAPST